MIMINGFEEASMIVDISKLEWSKPSSKSVKFDKVKAPKGFRLPTIHELYTAIKQEKFSDKLSFWSKDYNKDGYIWVASFGILKGIGLCVNPDSLTNQTIFVREI